MKEQSVPKKSGVGMRIGICISIAVLFLVFGGLTKGWAKAQSKSNGSLCQVQDGIDISRTPEPPGTLKKTGFGNVPLYFIPNKGQMNGKARFYAKTPGYTLWITQQGLVFDPGKPDRDVSCMVFKNANKNPEILSIESTSYKVNYLKGRDRSNWYTGIPTSKAVLYKELYKNIHLKVYGLEKQIEYDWVIKPGGNPGDIGFRYRDVKSSVVDEEGNLAIETASGKWLHKKPLAYQVINGQKVVVEAAFEKQKEEKNSFGFSVGSYDRDRELIIDPLVLVYSGYLGGSMIDSAGGVVVDGSGSLYVAGFTNSTNFPTTGALQGTNAGDYDGFITKFTPDGSGLVFSTYFGGSGSDGAGSICLDSSGLIYIAGATASTDFPLLNPYQAVFGGVQDAFVSVLSANGSSLVYSTYLGGADIDSGLTLSVTGSGEICVAGQTISSDFPVYNAYDSTFGGGAAEMYWDVFLAKFNASGSALVFSTYLGGGSSDTLGGLALAADGDIYIAGHTSSFGFPIVAAYQSSAGGSGDGFISRFSGTGALEVSTYFGGNRHDSIRDIALDTSGNVYVTGDTASTNFPTTSGAYQVTKPGGTGTLDVDIFIAKFTSISSQLAYSTYVGAPNGDSLPFAIAVGPSDKAYVTGWTESPDFPVPGAFQDTHAGALDALVLVLSVNGTSLELASFMGGSSDDWGNDITVDSSGYIYVGGQTWSTSFPTYQGFQATNAGLQDGFVSKIETQIQVSITLNTPNGAEVWRIGETHDITWDSTGIDDVRIDYSTDNGASWSNITTEINDGDYSWLIPNAPSTNCLIKVSNLDETVTDTSNEVFTISAEKTITVTAPNGTEDWDAGDNYYISWESTGVIDDVKIEYSLDNGVTWDSVIGSTTNDGYYSWLVPNTPSTNCLVKISNLDDTVSDTSDGVFTISPEKTITVTAPNGTENWEGGTTQDITWNSTGNISTVKIKYSLDNGVSWNYVIGATTNDGSYSWLVPNTPSTNCLVMVCTQDETVSDTSDGVFTISQQRTLTVTAPNGTEDWEASTNQNITWNSTGSINDVKIEYSIDNGVSWNSIIESTNNDGNHPWLVPNTPSGNCLVKITDTAGPASDTSDAVFTISAVKTVTVTAPNGGESWDALTSQNITWSGTGSIANVKIEYSADNGSTWNTVVASTPHDGSYSWTVPDNASANCLVKVTDAAGTASDTSDAVFTIIGVPKTINVSYPNGGETWEVGTNRTITWSSTGSIANVKIEYTTDNGSTWNTIEASTPNDHVQSWNIPDTPSANCLVRITDSAGTASDTSDAVFTIIPPVIIGVMTPNGGEDWEAGTGHDITWTCTVAANVKIQYSTDNGATWTAVTDSIPNTGSYTWTVPDTPSSSCLVKVFDPVTGKSDTSDAVFTISAAKTITVNSPNGGESWEALTTQSITWTSTGSIADVDIEYSVDNGITWDTVVSSTPDDGSYSWDIPNNPSVDCLVRITDTTGPTSDTSEAVFTITAPAPDTITVLTPNGGETWVGDSTENITWTSTGSITNVEIVYSVDNGVTWDTVVSSTPNDGDYAWVVNNNPSGNCLVKITDTAGPASDTSDAVFSITLPIVIEVTSPNGGENWEVGTNNNITWTSSGGVTNVNIEYSTDNGVTWTNIISSTPDTGSYTWTIPDTPSTNCLVKVSDSASASSDTSDAVFTIFSNQPVVYCDSSGTNQNYEWIAGVQVGSLNNPTGKSQYSDFTYLTENLSKGGSVNVSLTPGFAYSSYTEYWRIWIDYNQDGDFADAGEAVFSGSGRSIVSGSFVVPTSATNGNTRMRVSLKYGGYPPYCGTFYYGEVEDYTVNIQ